MRRIDFFEIVLLGAIWGGSFPLTRLCGPHFGIVTLIALRAAVAALFLLGIMVFRGGWSSLRFFWRPIALLGIINSAIPFTLLAYTTTTVSAGFASIMNSTAPIFGALVAYLWLKERLTIDRIAGLVLGALGTIVLFWNLVSFHAGGPGWGVLSGLTATLCYGISANYTRQKLAGANALAIAAGSQISAGLFLAPWAIWLGTSTPLSHQDLWIGALLAILCTAIAYLLYFRLIRNVGPARAITCTFLIPVFGVLWGAVMLGEKLSTQTLVGGTIVLTGTILSTGVVRVMGFNRRLSLGKP